MGGARRVDRRLRRATISTRTGPRAAAALLPSAPGVYRFRDERGRALYVGRAVDLRRRVTSYWSKAPEVRGLGRMVARIARLEVIPCDSAHEAAWLERNLLERSRATYNRSLGGQEVPVGIAVDSGSRRPGLRLLHEHQLDASPAAGVLQFGPYLGGEQARLAIDALRRVAPVHLAGEGITGSERAMAAALGVGPADRERLLGLVTGALTGEPAAFTTLAAALDARQTAAVDRLDFETAAAIRDELAALRWVATPGRMRGAEPRDGTVAGWCAGRLVVLGIEHGRVERWTERPASAAVAARATAATPDAWRPFLERAALLAARVAEAAA